MVPITQLYAVTTESLADVVCWAWPTEWVEINRRWHLRVDREKALEFEPLKAARPLADGSFARRFLKLDGTVSGYRSFFADLGHPHAPVGMPGDRPRIDLRLSIGHGEIQTFHRLLKLVVEVADTLATDTRGARDFLPRFGPAKGEWQLEHRVEFGSTFRRTTPEQAAQIAAAPERERPLLALQLFVDDALAELCRGQRVSLRVRSSFTPGRGHERHHVVVPSDLLGAILLQSLGAMSAGERWRTCEECGTPFRVSGHRKDKVMCGDPACRQRRRRRGAARPRG